MKYRREIDGLRALAVVPVILFHAGFPMFSGGYVGVDVFFVISGFLITSIIINEQDNGRFSLLRFYERRARRILPALFVVMTACAVAAWFWMLPSQLKMFSQNTVAVSTFASNILFWLRTGYFAEAAELNPLLHTWSLSVEEQFYIFFPLLLLVLGRLGKSWRLSSIIAIAAVSLAASDYASTHSPDANFYLLHTRAWELLIGAILACNAGRMSRSRALGPMPREFLSGIGLVLVLAAVVLYDKNTPFPGLYALPPTIGTALILVFGTSSTRVGQLLSTRPFVSVGLISYSAYLWHQPLFAFARIRALDTSSTTLLLSLACLSLLLAYLTWRFVETPFRDRKRISRRQVFALAGLTSATFIVAGAMGHRANGAPSRMSKEVLEMLAVKQEHFMKPGCHGDEANYLGPDEACALGSSTTRPTVALIGDSHALALSRSVGDYLGSQGLAGQLMSYSACPPVLGVFSPSRSSEHRCEQFNDDVSRFLDKHDTMKTVIVVARWPLYLSGKTFDNQEGGVERSGAGFVAPTNGRSWESDPDLRRRQVAELYAEAVKRLLVADKQVVLVYPIPEVGWNVPNYLAKSSIFHDRHRLNLSTSHNVFTLRNAEAYAALDAIGEHPNLFRVLPERIFCSSFIKGRCSASIDGAALYRDDDHLSLKGTDLLMRAIGPHLQGNRDEQLRR